MGQRPGKSRNWQIINADEVKKSNLIKSGCGCDLPVFTFQREGQTLEGRIRPCYKRAANDRARCAHIHFYTDSGEDVVVAIRMSVMLWAAVEKGPEKLWGRWIRITYKGKEPTRYGHFKKIFEVEVDKGSIAKAFETVNIVNHKSKKPRKRRPVCAAK